MLRSHAKAMLLAAALTAMPAQAWAEWQIKPFLGVTFGANTTFTDLDHAAGNSRLAVGVSGMLIGEIIGIEADVGHTPGFFTGDAPGHLVLKSGVTTLTGNVVLAMPRRLTKYTLRPYLVGGAGLMHVDIEDAANVYGGDNLATMDIGGGVTGFLTNRIGVSWDVRYFRSGDGPVVGNSVATGNSGATEKLSFWRANMALAVRF
jgi:hypothetical protein